jgi:hypothetical protein
MTFFSLASVLGTRHERKAYPVGQSLKRFAAQAELYLNELATVVRDSTPSRMSG